MSSKSMYKFTVATLVTLLAQIGHSQISVQPGQVKSLGGATKAQVASSSSNPKNNISDSKKPYFSEIVKSNKTDSVMKKAKGGADTGGGDSVTNPQGGRSLLDLVESNELEYFVPNMSKDSANIADLYTAEIEGCAELSTDSARQTPAPRSDSHKICDSNRVQQKLIFAPDLGNLNLPLLLTTSIGTCSGNFYAKLFWGPVMYGTPNLKWAFVDRPLEEVSDEGLIRYSNVETKVQLAAQKDGLVLVNRQQFEMLDADSKAALVLHEETLCAVKAMNPDLLAKEGTAPIRSFVRHFVQYANKFYNKALSAETISTTNIRESAEQLIPKKFKEVKLDQRSKQCTFKILSLPTSRPNVIATCEFKESEETRNSLVYSTFKIEISILAEVLSTSHFPLRNNVTDYYLVQKFGVDRYVIQEQQRTEAVKIVRENYKEFLKMWDEYVKN